MRADTPLLSDSNIRIVGVDYANANDALAVVFLLDAYAQDAAGGGEPLSDYARTHLASELGKRPQIFSLLAWDGAVPVGLVNCIEGFSTFACLPLVNIHDVAVLSAYRGKGIGRLLLLAAESRAKALGACKLTLEVLSLNVPARQLYLNLGFEDYQLDPNLGQANFMQKWLIPTVN